MSKYNNKSFILNKIKEVYRFNTNVEFAEFLGIKPQTLSSWYARNTMDYELVYSKCVLIDGNWLLSEKGEVLREKDSSETISILSSSQEKYQSLKDDKIENYLADENQFLKKQIALLETIIKEKQEIIDAFKSGSIIVPNTQK